MKRKKKAARKGKRKTKTALSAIPLAARDNAVGTEMAELEGGGPRDETDERAGKGRELAVVTPAGNDAREGDALALCERGNSTFPIRISVYEEYIYTVHTVKARGVMKRDGESDRGGAIARAVGVKWRKNYGEREREETCARYRRTMQGETRRKRNER